MKKPPSPKFDTASALEASRKVVRDFIAKAVSEDVEPHEIAMTLALACEQTGNTEAAAVLAVKHKLHEYGYTVSG
jgi:hypothetical protein